MAYRAFVIPTYPHHFSCNEMFLESFSQFCVDPDHVDINFILSENDIKSFMSISGRFNHLKIRLWTLKEILEKNGITVDEVELLSRIGKYNYQSIKKIYSCYTLKYEETIVLDSENVFVRPFEVKSIFDKASKRVIFTDDNIPLDVQKEVTKNCYKILGGFETDYNKWMFNTSYWYYDLKSVKDLFEYVKEVCNQRLFYVLCDHRYAPMFEAVLYNWFVYKYDHGYTFISLNKAMEECFKEKYPYFQERINRSGVALEYMCIVLDDETKQGITDFLNKYDVDIFSFAFGPSTAIQYCIDHSALVCKTYTS